MVVGEGRLRLVRGAKATAAAFRRAAPPAGAAALFPGASVLR